MEISCHLDPRDPLGVNSGRDFSSILQGKISHFVRDDILVKLFAIHSTSKKQRSFIANFYDNMNAFIGDEMNDWEPKITAFLCNWCSYGAADLAGVSRLQYPPYFRIIRVPCSARVGPKFILAALRHGVDGVWVSG